MSTDSAESHSAKIHWTQIPPLRHDKITIKPSPHDQAAEIWITVFRMCSKKNIRAFLKRVDEHDDEYHPISYQIERGVRYL